MTVQEVELSEEEFQRLVEQQAQDPLASTIMKQAQDGYVERGKKRAQNN